MGNKTVGNKTVGNKTVGNKTVGNKTVGRRGNTRTGQQQDDGTSGCAEGLAMRADTEEARHRREARDAEYRAALGLPVGAALPASLGAVGGSRGGGHGNRINLKTTGWTADWHHPTRPARKRRRKPR